MHAAKTTLTVSLDLRLGLFNTTSKVNSMLWPLNTSAQCLFYLVWLPIYRQADYCHCTPAFKSLKTFKSLLNSAINSLFSWLMCALCPHVIGQYTVTDPTQLFWWLNTIPNRDRQPHFYFTYRCFQNSKLFVCTGEHSHRPLDSVIMARMHVLITA